MSARTEELKNDLTATVIYGEQIGEKLQNPDLTQSERADLASELEAVETKAKGIKLEYERAQKDDERELRIKNIGREHQLQTAADASEPAAVNYKSAVDALFDNDVFKHALQDKAFRESTEWKTGNIEYELKAPMDPVDSNPDDMVQHLRPGIVTPFVYPQRIAGLFTNLAMDGSSVSWLDMPGADGGADYVAYGGQKPSADVSLDVHVTKASKIATTYTVPDDALDDLTGLRATLEQVLMVGPNGIGVKAEAGYIGGSGTGTPLELAGIDSLSPTDLSGSGSNFVADIMGAALDIESETGAPATAAVLHPNDYFLLITLEGDDGRPLFAPFGNVYQAPSPLGFPVIRSKAVTPGTVYVGAWNLAYLYTRMAVNIRATREGIGLADKNLTMFVAETRQALVHPYGKSPFRTVSIGS